MDFTRLTISESATCKILLNAKDIYESLKDIATIDQESFWLLGFNLQMQEIYRECLFRGGLNASVVDQRLIFKRLISNDCQRFIVVHNHPSGSLDPSNEDITMTRKLKECGDILGITLCDSIIISSKGYKSLAENKHLYPLADKPTT